MILFKTDLPIISIKHTPSTFKNRKITSSKDGYDILKPFFDPDTFEYSEEFLILLLNRANNTLGVSVISKGGLSGTVADGKIIFTQALLTGASAIILAHNHPSGQHRPSDTDISLTKKLIEFGKLIDLQIFDHLIFTKDTYTSMADEGLI